MLLVGFVSALLPDEQIARLVGDDGLRSTLTASLVGALFYFATLTEVPIAHALVEHGMARGPALALLLAGPALSLPNMIVIAKVMGVRKTAVFCAVIVVAATATGMLFGRLAWQRSRRMKIEILGTGCRKCQLPRRRRLKASGQVPGEAELKRLLR